ncbi:MAG TPA: D-alanyl-D-alanine carboxypeptidase/D-alanyl-D-alanine-endopeptidase [Pseudomonas sp.]|nr:D-alanyl-D-alanine carboxypeptidase/D-alanyl-D-alanine-endopeptidase [Pseudomonas sp.]
MKRWLPPLLAGGVLFSLLIPAAPAALAEERRVLPPEIQRALSRNKMDGQALSLVAIPLNGPGQVTAYNADVPVNPASTIKLVTTYAALELLGPTHTWKTELYADGPLRDGVLHGNLYLKGGGDPKLNMERLWLLLRDLRSHGVDTISGDLVLDRSHFVQPRLPEFDDDGSDANRPYLVAPDALLINLNAQRFSVRSEGGRVHVSAEPPLEAVRIDNRVRALPPRERCPAWPQVTYRPIHRGDSVTLVVSGELAQGCKAHTYLALLDHHHYAAGTVRAIWGELGGRLLGADRIDKVPDDARMLVRAESPDLVEVIRDINKYSNNTMARQLFLSLGAAFRLPEDSDDAAAAQRVIRQWLARKGLATARLVLENGSGLSRSERVTARGLAGLLQSAWQSPFAAEFISSMPLAALDGTMRKRLQDTAVAGKAHIKTGTLNNVRAIAGYSRDVNGNSWAVVAILNHPRPWGAAAVLDQVLLSLYEQPRGNKNTARR